MQKESKRGRGVGGLSRRAAAWLAWFLWALCVAFAALAVLVALYTPPLRQGGPGYGVLLAVAFLVYPTVGALVALRRPRNPVGWILCGVGLLLGSQGLAVAYAGYALSARPGWVPGGKIAHWVSGWFDYPMLFLAAALLILLFPDGRLPDRSWRVALWLAVGGSVLATLRYATNGASPFFFYTPIRNPVFEVGGALGVTVDLLGRLGLAALFVICVASMIAVFVRLGSAQGEKRQQIKWFAYAATVLLSAVFLSQMIGATLAALGVPWGVAIAIPIVLALLAVPVAVGVAILRYRLYDIDRIINRTLVHGALTALLAAGYFATVGALQGIASLVFQVPVRALTGRETQLATVAATLAMAALFNPLRRRIQSFIDRRFYRKKYDARKTLEAFSAKLRNDTDLDALSDDLVGMVRETMQPAHVSLWLRPETAQKVKQPE
jgi:hypothetical protein